MYQYNWLFQANSIGEFFKRLGIIILTVFSLVVYFIGIYFLIATYIKSVNLDYILITTKVLDNIICLVFPLIILFMVAYKIIVKIKTRRYRLYKSTNKIFSFIYYLILLSIIMVFVNSLNNYTVLYKDKIVKNNIIGYFEKEYYYTDIESADIGISWRGKRYPSLYYKLKFNDDYKLNLANGILLGNYDIDKLVNINDILIENKILRNVDRVYLEVYTIDLNEYLKLSMEKLFRE